MSNRYSVLSELGMEEQAQLALSMCKFFSPLSSNKFRALLDLPENKNSIHPLTVYNFFEYMRTQGIDVWPKMQRIKELIEKLKQKHILQSRGGCDINEALVFMRELTEREKKGRLWLGKALGCSFIGNEIEKDIVHIEGTTKKGIYR